MSLSILPVYPPSAGPEDSFFLAFVLFLIPTSCVGAANKVPSGQDGTSCMSLTVHIIGSNRLASECPENGVAIILSAFGYRGFCFIYFSWHRACGPKKCKSKCFPAADGSGEGVKQCPALQ